ncbi:hypothetical protein DFH27DRAFT_15951 [Peziza echinospora]|nr:hypothetical protein DFH27DRAFT_15951 [Peziza echinospora]
MHFPWNFFVSTYPFFHYGWLVSLFFKPFDIRLFSNLFLNFLCPKRHSNQQCHTSSFFFLASRTKILVTILVLSNLPKHYTCFFFFFIFLAAVHRFQIRANPPLTLARFLCTIHTYLSFHFCSCFFSFEPGFTEA